MIDVRHEQAAALSAQAYSRLLQKPGVCMAASGPGIINLTTGIANAFIDCAPVVALGGSSAIGLFGRQTFQEIDQLAIIKPCTKWADRVVNLKRIPEMVNSAFQKAMGGKPGPVYLDFPADILYEKIDEAQVDWRLSGRPLLNPRPLGEQARVDELIDALAKAKQPLVVSGSGVIWSQAWAEMQTFVEKAGIPFYTTPQGRGVRARRSSAVVHDDALDRVQGCRPDPHPRHAHELHHRPRLGAALRRQREDRAHRYRRRRARHRAAQDRHPDPRRLQGGAAAVDRRAAEAHRAGELRAVAQEARRRRSREEQGNGRRHVDEQDADPSAAPVRGSEELHEARRDPLRGRPGDPELRPPVDADLRAGTSPQFRSVRHDGRRHAFRRRRQGRVPGQAGHRACTATARSA